MDTKTIQYYDENAELHFQMYQDAPSGPAKYFEIAFAPGCEVLDIGTGSGRDMALLMSSGYKPFGVEPSGRFRALAEARFPRLAGRIWAGALPGLSAQFNRKFDGILCAAVFQHIPEEQQLEAAVDMRNLLNPGGRLLLSFPKDRPGIDASGRDDHGRLYITLLPETLDPMFARLGLEHLGTWTDLDTLGRPGITWTTMLFELRR
jgi:SAM-dependent methyltransferase